jgi:hypothetical protein
VYSLGPLFLFLLTSLVVALVVAWVSLLLSLVRQRKLSALPAHLKTVFIRPCGAPTEEKPKVINQGEIYLRQKSRKKLHGKGGGGVESDINRTILTSPTISYVFLCYFNRLLLFQLTKCGFKKGGIYFDVARATKNSVARCHLCSNFCFLTLNHPPHS